MDENQFWWIVEVFYKYPQNQWDPIAIFKYEEESTAYVTRHNSHAQAGMLRAQPLASWVESSARPDLPALIEVLVGNSALACS